MSPESLQATLYLRYHKEKWNAKLIDTILLKKQSQESPTSTPSTGSLLKFCNTNQSSTNSTKSNSEVIMLDV